MGRPTPWEPPAERRVRPTPRYHRIGREEFVGAAGRKSRERRREMTENAREAVGKTSGSDAEADGCAADAVRVAGTCGGAVEGETVLDRYFALSDTAGEAPEDFEELVSLFSPQAQIFPGRGGAVVEGIDAVRAFSTANFLIATSNCATCGRRECSRTGSTLPAGRLQGADRRTRSSPCPVATSPKWTTSAES